MGIFYDKSRNKYRVTVLENKQRKYIGQYDTKRKATKALAQYNDDRAFAAIIDLNEPDVSSLFLETNVPKAKNNPPKTSLMSHIKATIALWQKKLNEL